MVNVEKISSQIEGLDKILNSGIPKGRVTAIVAVPARKKVFYLLKLQYEMP